MKRTGLLWFAAFTAVFAALAAFVFWGCWSPDFAFVAPDDAMTHETNLAAVWGTVLRTFWTRGCFIPSDILGQGLLGSPDFCQELKYVAALYCSGLGLAYFLRGRGLSLPAAFGAGLLLAFCGYWSTLFSAGHYGWFVWMTYGVFAFGLADRAVRSGHCRHWLLLGATTAWGSFRQPDLWLLFTIFTGVYFLFCCVRERKFPWKGLLLAGAVFGAVGAPSFYDAFAVSLKNRDEQIAKGETVAPVAEGKKDAVAEAETRWIFVTNWSLPARETAEFVVPRLNGDTSCPMTLSVGMRRGSGIKPYAGALGRPKDAPSGNYRQHSLYVGWVTCLLALFAALGAGWKSRESKSREVIFFAVAALVFWLFSLGRNCEPVYRVVYALPFGDYLRAPVKWHHLTEFCLAVLAGFGIDASFRFLRARGCGTKMAFALVGLLVVFGAVDLARVDRLYCAPVSIREARAKNCEMRLSVLARPDFENPQVKELRRRGYIVSIANYLGHPDYYLVGLLTPRKPFVSRPLPSATFLTGLGFLSLAGLCAVLVCTLVPAFRRRWGEVHG